MNRKMPALFVGHGSPMNAISHNAYAAALKAQAEAMAKPEAVVVVSAHWLAPGTRVTSSPRPRQMYDFSGFPEELYRIAYAPAGAPELAAHTVALLSSAGIHGVTADPERGIDHAAWAVLVHMYPDATIPTLEVSLDYRSRPEEFFALGAALAPLRKEDVLVMGSGNIVHNLSEFEFRQDAPVYLWAREFDTLFRECAVRGDREALASFATPVEASRKAVPTSEHYLPALTVLGCAEKGDRLRFFNEFFQNASISMRCFAIEAEDEI